MEWYLAIKKEWTSNIRNNRINVKCIILCEKKQYTDFKQQGDEGMNGRMVGVMGVKYTYVIF